MSDELTVFVVDDDVGAAGSVSALMASIGLNSELYSSATEFLATYDGSRIGCLVLDVRLEGMSGLELQEVLSVNHRDLPVIIISGHADQELRDKARRNGAVACFEKPFNCEEFCEAVRTTLAKVIRP